ncbi:hypothetical protein JL475_20740 [Streptomyces sp. M2CJ-2]|uniref:hypothetical protein n=1 Tax=Streptomyces sp. M2CJ-2 TaxID=2803948 RepID=UPI001926EA89|nr:hypothetical protein [Streptomyces sp. M2CJ-2]MBL3668374.1 hypothetical protein [Streptomyces sp. M2CJ-2]
MTTPPPPPDDQRPPSRRRPWARAQHRAAAGHFVRGLAYGTGLAIASLVSYWLQQVV